MAKDRLARVIEPDPEDDDVLVGEIDDGLGPEFSRGFTFTIEGVEFAVRDRLPSVAVTRHADNSLMQIKVVMERVLQKDRIDEMWDIAQEMDEEDFFDAFNEMMEQYAPNRPTRRAISSSKSSGRTGRSSRTR